MTYTQDPREEKYLLSRVGDVPGVVLDIGAADGLTFSNSAALIERGWSAVLIEPAPWFVQALAERYKAEIEQRRVYVIQGVMKGIVTDRIAPFHLCYKDGQPAMVNTLGGYVKTTWEKDHEYRTIDVMCMDWDELWDWWPFRLALPRVVSIDAEGQSLALLESLKIRTHTVCVEANNDGEYRQVQAWSASNGYREGLRTNENVWLEKA